MEQKPHFIIEGNGFQLVPIKFFGINPRRKTAKRIIVGKIRVGEIEPGDEIVIISSNKKTTLEGSIIEIQIDNKTVNLAKAGDIVGLSLLGIKLRNLRELNSCSN